MREFIEDLCERVGTKTVSVTDKSKGAFVLNEEQRKVMSQAGFEPGEGGLNAVRVMLEVANSAVGLRLDVSYYNSIREGAGRTPEARMGRDIVHWMEVGDEVNLANIGSTVYVWKTGSAELSLIEFAKNVASDVDHIALLEKARQVAGRPLKQEKIVNDFRRNVAVVAGAIARAEGQCEMPGCGRATFNRTDGSVFWKSITSHLWPKKARTP